MALAMLKQRAYAQFPAAADGGDETMGRVAVEDPTVHARHLAAVAAAVTAAVTATPEEVRAVVQQGKAKRQRVAASGKAKVTAPTMAPVGPPVIQMAAAPAAVPRRRKTQPLQRVQQRRRQPLQRRKTQPLQRRTSQSLQRARTTVVAPAAPAAPVAPAAPAGAAPKTTKTTKAIRPRVRVRAAKSVAKSTGRGRVAPFLMAPSASAAAGAGAGAGTGRRAAAAKKARRKRRREAECAAIKEGMRARVAARAADPVLQARRRAEAEAKRAADAADARATKAHVRAQARKARKAAAQAAAASMADKCKDQRDDDIPDDAFLATDRFDIHVIDAAGSPDRVDGELPDDVEMIRLDATGRKCPLQLVRRPRFRGDTPQVFAPCADQSMERIKLHHYRWLPVFKPVTYKGQKPRPVRHNVDKSGRIVWSVALDKRMMTFSKDVTARVWAYFKAAYPQWFEDWGVMYQ